MCCLIISFALDIVWRYGRSHVFPPFFFFFIFVLYEDLPVSCIVAPLPLLERNGSLYSDSGRALVAVMYCTASLTWAETGLIWLMVVYIAPYRSHLRGTLYISTPKD